MNKLDIALVGMPVWTVEQPTHSLGIVGGITRDAGAVFAIHDINIEFYHHVADDEKEHWREDRINRWLNPELSDGMWKKYESWLLQKVDEVLAGKPEIVAFTVNMWSRVFTINAAKHIKSKAPGTLVMFGGVDCFLGEQNKNLLSPKSGWHCDIICQGESEIAFAKFIREYLTTRSWKTSIPGFAYYDGGKLVDTGRVELPSLQDQAPIPAYDRMDLAKYTNKGALPFYFTRGCPFRCRFCSETVNFSHFRCRKPEEAFAELMAIVPLAKQHAKVPTLKLSDSIFNTNIKRLDRFADLIIESGHKINWGGQAHIFPQMTTEFLEKLARTGLTGFFWGMETGSQKVVDLMKKAFKQEDARRILSDCSRLGIKQWIPILVGFPGEEAEDFCDTLEFILEFGAKPGITILAPSEIVVRPNSELYDNYEKYGLADIDPHNWRTADGRNTRAARLMRAFMGRQAQGNRDLSIAGITGMEVVAAIPLDDAAWNDVYIVMRENFRRGGHEELFQRLLRELFGGEDKWNRARRDDAAQREKLYSMILLSLRALNKRPASEITVLSLRGPIDGITVRAAKPLMNVETMCGIANPMVAGEPVKVKGRLDVCGWAVDSEAKKAASGVYVHIGGKMFPAFYGAQRNDVSAHFNVPQYEACGFSADISVDAIGKGRHSLALVVLSADGKSMYKSDAMDVIIE